MVKQEEAVGWQSQGLLDLLTDVARGIGVGSPADFGWAPPPPPGAPQQVMMTGGIPDPGTLPGQALLDAIGKVLATSQPEALRYGGTEGYEPLRGALAERWMRVDGLPQTPQNFVLTNGSSGAIDLVCSAFINPGDGVIVESPSYSGTLRTFRGHGARLLPAPIDADGVDVDAIEAILKREQAAGTPVKMIYIIPDYQNPTGTLLTLARRERLVELSNRYRALVLEDDAYIDLAFSQNPLPSVYAVADGQGVLRAGTFSKTLATGLRVGWVQGRADFVQACVQMRFDMGASPLLHRALAEVVASGFWEKHIAKMRDIYAEKCDAICRGLLEECEPYAQFVRPQGGFFVWLRCRDGLSAAQVQKYAMDEGVMTVPGRSFFAEAGNDTYLRLAFSTVSPGELREGARRLGRAFARAAG
jgi:2-aminoadipate transaminase